MKLKKYVYFKSKNTPAVTRVLLWTRADTGVGALMAIGSQLPKGTWALFVKDAKIKNVGVIFVVM
jgi:hypothetical protein